MNDVKIMGRLTKDLEVRYTQNGLAYSRFSVAVDRYKKEGSETDFIPCTAFGKTAESISQYLGKGSRILISGNIKTGSYEKDGKKNYTFEVYVDRFEFCERRNQTQDQAPAPAPAAPQQPQQNIPDGFIPVDPQEVLEDLPF